LNAYYQSYTGSTNYTSEEKKKNKIIRATRRIERLAKYTTGKNILDVGCNYGYTIISANNLGFNAFGIDIDGTAIESCKNNINKNQFKAITIEDYSNENPESMDIVYTAEVLEHVLNPFSFISSINKVLKKGGILYLTTPDVGHLMVPHNKENWKEVRPPEHITYLNKQSLKRLLERNGFKIEKFFFNIKPGIRVIARKI